MNSIENLTIRTTRAVGRLTTLRRRAESASPNPAVLQEALDELAATLDDLRAANDNLADHAAHLTASRDQYDKLRRDYLTLFTALPIACLFTDEVGSIVDANPVAARLLNVGRQHLAGKPLFLFFTNRDRLIQTFTSTFGEEFQQVVVLRPRERRPREVLVRGTRLPDGQRWCWFLEPPPQAAPADAKDE